MKISEESLIDLDPVQCPTTKIQVILFKQKFKSPFFVTIWELWSYWRDALWSALR